ncbi:MAG: adenosylcobinamide-GDP ribazoletransferase [Christensenellaceae bacterium]|jgi:adenosylcobinamide-GDP ribazoletransferase
MNALKRMGLAFSLMTRLPVKLDKFWIEPRDYAECTGWFFLPALFVGAASAFVYWLFLLTGIPYLAALMCVLANVFLTGGLHIDGLADTCDAFFAHKDKVQTLAILKDSRQGTFGVLGLVFAVGIKTVLIGQLGTAGICFIVLAPVCGKIPLMLCALEGKYPRVEGMGRHIIGRVSQATGFIGVLLPAAIVYIFGGYEVSGCSLPLMVLIGLLLNHIANKKAGGATGDVLGACNELGEIVFLIVAAIWA